MRISKQEVEHVALLARLELSEAEVDQYTEQLNSILVYAEKLQKLDTSDVNPTAHAVQLFNVLRPDEVNDSMTQKEALSNAPKAEDGYFCVPRIV